MQEIPVHGAEPSEAHGWIEGQDSRHPEDARLRAVLEAETGWSPQSQGNKIGGVDTAQDEDEPIETTFELNDTLYSKAKIPPTNEVYIWLGVRFL